MRPVWKREQIEAGVVRVRPLLSGGREPSPASATPVAATSEPTSAVSDETVARHLRLLNALAAGLVRERSRQLQDLRPELLKLVLAISRELLGREVATDPTVVESTLRAALTAMGDAAGVRARLHPEDVAFLEAEWAALLEPERPRNVVLVADATVHRGACRLESDRGDLDATWETQLRLIAEALRDDLEEPTE